MSEHRTVYVVDDDEAVRGAVAFFLGMAEQLTVETFASGPEFLEALPRLEPGCVLLDIHMPRMSGIEVLDRLRESEVRMPVIMLTGRGDIGLAVRAMKAGAVDFLEKPYDNNVLLATLRAGFEVLDQHSEEEGRVQNARTRVARLSRRERQILQGLLAGFPNKIIAYELDLSVRTVEIYRAHLMDKLQSPSLSIAVRMALAAGVEPLARERR